MIAITGSTGQLGQLVIKHLLCKVAGKEIIALARNLEKATSYKDKGIQVRKADYTNKTSLRDAFEGVEKLLLISSNEIGKRAEQHANVISAAKEAGVKLIAYTSILHADANAISLAPEHSETEKIIKASGIPFIILRNGWYTENYTASVSTAVENGAFIGSAKDGKISSASREDYAEAAVAALTSKASTGKTYELAGDTSYTLTDLAAEISKQTGKEIPYKDLPASEYAKILVQVGLPQEFANAIADWDVSASKGALYGTETDLQNLIGHPTTPLSEAIKNTLK